MVFSPVCDRIMLALIGDEVLDLKNYVLLTANAGVLICLNNKKILVDAMHNKKTYQFSRVADEILRKIAGGEGDFTGVDAMLYTHDHPDHYSKNWTQRALDWNPGLHLVSPVRDFADLKNVHVLTRPIETLQIAGVQITARQIPHDGSDYASVLNYAYLLDMDGYRILLLGDGVMDAKAVQAVVEGREIHLALLNFPFLTLKRGRDIMDHVICAQKYLFFHLPSLEDDINGYAPAAARSILRFYQNNASMRLLEEHKKEPIGFKVQ